MVAAIDEVKRILPRSRATMSLSTHLVSHRADDVEVDHADLLVEIGLDERPAQSDAGVDAQHVDGTPRA
jgi:hypothetical protein